VFTALIPSAFLTPLVGSLPGDRKGIWHLICFSSHFPGGPGLAGTGMSPFWILLELMVMEVVVVIGAVRHAKP